MRALLLALVATLSLAACDGGDPTVDPNSRGAVDGMVADSDGASGPVDTAVPVSPPVCPVAFRQLTGGPVPAYSTIAGVTYLCYYCAPVQPYDPQPGGCLWDAGGTKPVLCVTDFVAAGCH